MTDPEPEPTQKSKIELEPTQKSKIGIEPTQKSKVELEPTQKSKIELEPTQKSKIGIEPTQKSKVELEPTQKSKIGLEPTQKSKIEQSSSNIKSEFFKKMSFAAPPVREESASRRVTKTIVTSPHIYAPVGPYSQAILADKTLYVSGVLGLDKDGQMVCGGAERETRQALENMKHVLEAGGASLLSVVKVTILLHDIQDFKIVNQVYSEFFTKDYPARATYQVANLPKDAAVEIECIALSGDLVVSEVGPCPCTQE